MDGNIRVYDIKEGKVSKVIAAGPGETWSVTHHPSRDMVASGTHKGTAHLWNTKEGTKMSSLGGNNQHFVLSVSFSPDGKQLAAGAQSGAVTVYDVESGKVLHTFTNQVKPVRALAFSPDGASLLTGSDDMHINVYEVKNGQHTASLPGHTSWVLSLAFQPSGALFASASSDRRVKLWDTRQQRECVHTFDAHADQCWAVAFSPDGERLVSVGDDATLNIFATAEK